MTKTNSLFLSLVVLGLLAVPARPTRDAAHAQVVSRPNIIFILADDLDEGVYGRMTRLRALLGDQGLTFANSFVSLSLCCPSRTTSLRGQYAHNTRVFTNGLPGGGFRKVLNLGLESSTFATWLQDAGYHTVFMGKYLNGYPSTAGQRYVPPGWNEWYSPVSGTPYSEYNYTMNENAQLVAYGAAPEDYMVDVLSAKANDVVQRTVGAGTTPFLMYISLYVPHGPATPAPRYIDEFPGEIAPRTASYNELDVSDKPAFIQTLPPLTLQQRNQMDNLYRKRLQSMLGLEDLVESLLQTLADTGQLANTYIFFTSDNGFHQGQHRLVSGKNTGYEEDLRVPLVIRGPGVPVGEVRHHMAANIDLAPTFAELAGAPVPAFVDGRSLVPLLGDDPPPEANWRQTLLLEHGFPGDPSPGGGVTLAGDGTLEPPDTPQQAPAGAVSGVTPGVAPVFQGLHTADNQVYIEYETGELEYYDRNVDPDQLTNAATTADPDLLGRLASRLNALRDCAGADCRTEEDIAPLRFSQFKPWHKGLAWSPPFARWLEGGQLNVALNYLDRRIGGGDATRSPAVGERVGRDAR